MILIIPFRTPSVNHLYFNWQNRRILTKEAKSLKREIIDLINLKEINVQEYRDKKLAVQVDVYEDWLTKKGEVKKKDVSNREKFLIDTVFEALGLDDKFIFEHTMIKKQSKTEKSIIKIEVFE